ncbi:MAG: hypothetical protein WCY88_07150 [Spongiibacteraceae bacterium]
MKAFCLRLLCSQSYPLGKLLTALLVCCGLAPAVQADNHIIYLWNRNFDTAPVNQLLELALSKTLDLYPAVEVRRSAAMEQEQAFQLLLDGSNGLDVVSGGSSQERDSQYLAIKFPVLKGLLGHRVCLIRKGEQSLFDGILTAYDFRQKNLQVCQGSTWPDTHILQRNGFPVVVSTQYSALFTMLSNKQCDCFLRGAQEIIPEYLAHKDQFDIEKNMLVRYALPGLFYLNKRDAALAARIELGLLRALDDGSYDAFFEAVMRQSLDTLKLNQRTVLQLNSPDVSAVTIQLQSMKKLWYPL